MRRMNYVALLASFCFWLVPLVAQADMSDKDVLTKLQKAYPNLITTIKDNKLIFADGYSIVYDDGIKNKSEDDLFDKADIKDMFHWAYPATVLTTVPTEDPGRVRNAEFFNHIYGDCTKGQVEKNLVDVSWLGKKKLKMTRINGVAEKLQAVSDDILKAGKDVIGAAAPSAGTFNCRVIDGTTRQSVHGVGIAIDVNLKFSDYWRWRKEGYRNRIPQGLVEIFEKHGFIWGGKWAHFDTMHFEYRPELLP